MCYVLVAVREHVTFVRRPSPPAASRVCAREQRASERFSLGSAWGCKFSRRILTPPTTPPKLVDMEERKRKEKEGDQVRRSVHSGLCFDRGILRFQWGLPSSRSPKRAFFPHLSETISRFRIWYNIREWIALILNAAKRIELARHIHNASVTIRRIRNVAAISATARKAGCLVACWCLASGRTLKTNLY